jgi:predicted membrane protein
MAKRRRIDKYNGQKKKDRQIQWLKEEGQTNTMAICLSFFFWPLYLSILLLLAIVFVYPSSFSNCICLSFFFWPLYLSILLLLAIVFVYPSSLGQTNTMAKRRRIYKYNGQKKKDRQIQWPKEEG